MSTMMEQLTNDVTENVITQIKSKLLPAISDRYDIPLTDLVELINKPANTGVIRAKPKPKASKSSSKASSTGDLVALKGKIADAKEQNKFFNVSTGRPLVDNAGNRKKYTFIDDLHICGNGEKLENAKEMLKVKPVHKQAESAKKRAKEQSTSKSEEEVPAPRAEDYLESSEESEDAPPKKASKAKAKGTGKKVTSESSEEESEEAPPKKAKGKQVTSESSEESEDTPPPKKASKAKAKGKGKQVTSESSEESEDTPPPKKASKAKGKGKKVTSESSEEESEEAPPKKASKAKGKGKKVTSESSDEESEEAPPKKASKAKAKGKGKKVTSESSDEESEEAPPKKASKAKGKGKGQGKGKKVTSESSEEEAEEAPKKDPVVKLSNLLSDKKGKQPQARYNAKLKQWWNPETKYVLKRKGVKSVIIGKENSGKVVPLSSKDVKTCKELGWVVDTSILNDSDSE